MKINLKYKPVLDNNFVPAIMWNKAFQKQVEKSADSAKLIIAFERSSGAISVYKTQILKHSEQNVVLNLKYAERLLKSLLWMRGGVKIYIACDKELFISLQQTYSPSGVRAFDYEIMGDKIYGDKFELIYVEENEIPNEKEIAETLGGNLNGCRIGFDLGGSDRKSAAVIDGKVVFSEEIEWSPYFEKNSEWHKKEIQNTLKRCAEKLPRVDAIGGSSAGVYVNNQVRVASLFRGVSQDEFNSDVVNMFLDIQKEWNNVPFIIVNDGDVTALAGAMALKDNGVFGMSMGTSQAVGYVNEDGNITDWLNELAFAPIDYRNDAPVDEWSGDIGCGVQYFSQQAVARLANLAGIEFNDDMPFPERLIKVQNLIENNDDRAVRIYQTIGTYFGYTIAYYAEFYDFHNLLILGRVTSGIGGDLIISIAKEVLSVEFPELAKKIEFSIPDEKNKRHGQAVAAASLPKI